MRPTELPLPAPAGRGLGGGADGTEGEVGWGEGPMGQREKWVGVRGRIGTASERPLTPALSPLSQGEGERLKLLRVLRPEENARRPRARRIAHQATSPSIAPGAAASPFHPPCPTAPWSARARP